VISSKISEILLKSVSSEVSDKSSKGFSKTSQFLDIMMNGIGKIKWKKREDEKNVKGQSSKSKQNKSNIKFKISIICLK